MVVGVPACGKHLVVLTGQDLLSVNHHDLGLFHGQVCHNVVFGPFVEFLGFMALRLQEGSLFVASDVLF